MTVRDLIAKLVAIWKTSGRWKTGRGFYEFQFATFEDMHMV
ncbi:hypothetical protein A2U01_0116746, partial [Trifolium medium]|nr:hypothetical protein [Trifolium medium]